MKNQYLQIDNNHLESLQEQMNYFYANNMEAELEKVLNNIMLQFKVKQFTNS